jgi:thioredoxin reductase (NADPH)
MQVRLVVYIRHGCHLCTDMVHELELLKTGLDFGYTLCDIDTDAALAARYGDAVPVLMGGDTEVCRFFLDHDRLREYCGAA